MAEIAPLRPGDPERLGAYRLTGLLGEGGQGSVYLAEGDGGDRVAIKLLHARFSGDAKARSRFAAELQVARRVSPFCTARILDADVEGDRPYIVSEYIDGPSLSKVLATKGPRSGGDLDRLAIGTMTALAAIHQAGVVHRDFKPANVLVAPDGPRVIDFGIARALDATGTMSSTAVGTPAYMAPEQITGGRIGPQADVWAWGATMVYAASGHAAFGQDSIPAVMHRILNLPPDLGALTEPLRGLVARCLSKDPAARPSSQQVLMQLLVLAGSLPGPAAEAAPEAPAAMLNQGAEAAATDTRLGLAPPDSAYAPGGPQATPQPAQGAFAPPALPQGFPQGAPAGPGPRAPGTPGGAWTPPPAPGRPGNGPVAHPSWQQLPSATSPGGSGGRSRRRGIGVLAAGGGAALVALVVGASVVLTQMNGDENRPPAPQEGGEARLALATPTSTNGEIDPSHAGLGTERFLSKQLFTGLTEVTRDGTSRLRLARSITPDDACRQWKIEIKPGTTFSDGEPVDAEAFARGWARNARSVQANGFLMSGIKGYVAVSGGRSQTFEGVRASGNLLQVELDGADCEFDERLADPVFAPAPKDAGKQDNRSYNLNPIGNGPFKLQSYRANQEAVLVRNERWAFGRTKLDGVRVQLSANPALRISSFAAGSVDWIPVGTDTTRSARTERNLQVRPAMSQRLLIPITTRGPMRDRRARQAVSYALDRKRIGDTAMHGLGRPAIGLVSPAVPGFAESGRCPACERQNTAEARRLAEAAGLGPGTELNIYFRETGTYRVWTQAVAEQLKQVLGWEVTLRAVPIEDYRQFTKEITAKDAEGLIALGWQPDYPSAYTMLQPLLGGDQIATADNGRTNYGGWKDATFDATLARAITTRDEASRTRGMLASEKRALDDMAIIPVLTDMDGALVSDRFTGLGLDPDGDPTVATAARK
ncbi:ABC transporter substrate-binding protein [Actinomadura sp. NPDC047616]|uniref:ABC transporter substrate-binding protein n=1 Tax=Actinomadura sp. NPDC047616 TaxID=3155914 RepID=UPI0033CFA8E6